MTTTASEPPWLAGLLVCPSCHETLEALPDPRAFACANGHSYPVVGGIPRFVPEGSYADNFGFQWTTFRTTQLDDDERAESEEAFGPKTELY